MQNPRTVTPNILRAQVSSTCINNCQKISKGVKYFPLGENNNELELSIVGCQDVVQIGGLVLGSPGLVPLRLRLVSLKKPSFVI